MSYALLASLGLFALLGMVFVSRRNRARTPLQHETSATPLSPQAQLHRLQHQQNVWGVRVESHCRASSQLAGRQFPFDAAPALPVEGCQSTVCNCVFVGIPERRSRTDRRTGIDRRRSMRLESSDRRAGERPRRRDDQNSWSQYGHL